MRRQKQPDVNQTNNTAVDCKTVRGGLHVYIQTLTKHIVIRSFVGWTAQNYYLLSITTDRPIWIVFNSCVRFNGVIHLNYYLIVIRTDLN